MKNYVHREKMVNWVFRGTNFNRAAMSPSVAKNVITHARAHRFFCYRLLYYGSRGLSKFN